MSFDRSIRYPTKWLPPTASFPFGVPKNSTTETSKDGVPFEKDYISDTEGYFQGMLSRRNITLSGNPDTALISDYLDALGLMVGITHATVSDAIADVTLKKGMQIRTADNNSSARGGGGNYLVKTDQQAIDDDDDIGGFGNHTSAVSGLVLILQPVRGAVSVRQYGIIGDNTIDDTLAMQALIDSGCEVLDTEEAGLIFKVSRLTGRSNLKITGNGTFDFSANAAFADTFADPLFPFRGSAGSVVLLTADAVFEGITLTVASTSGLAEGSLIEVAAPTDNGGFIDLSVNVKSGELVEVLSVDSGTQITLTTQIMQDDGYTTANAAQIRLITPVENVIIGHDIKIKGKGRDATEVGDIGLFFLYGRNVKVHCDIEDVDARALFFSSCYVYEATNMRIIHPQKGANNSVNYGISNADSSKFGEIAFNELHNMRHGVASSHVGSALSGVYGVSRMTNVHHNKAYNTWHAAYSTHQDTELFTVNDNEATNCVFGINLRERRMTAMNNKLVNCGQDFLLTGRPRKILIKNNEGYGGGFLLTTTLTNTFDMDDVSIVGNKKYGGNGGINLIFPTATTSHKRLYVALNEINNIDGQGGNDAGIRIEGQLSSPIVNFNKVHGVANGIGIRVIAVIEIEDGEINGNQVRDVSAHAYQFSTLYTNTYAKYNSGRGYGGSFMLSQGQLANSASVLIDNTSDEPNFNPNKLEGSADSKIVLDCIAKTSTTMSGYMNIALDGNGVNKIITGQFKAIGLINSTNYGSGIVDADIIPNAFNSNRKARLDITVTGGTMTAGEIIELRADGGAASIEITE